MPADISRDSFDERKDYASVLLQQGRVLTDADWNEQAAIMQHALRVLSRDLFGAHAVSPRAPADSFKIEAIACSPGRIHGRVEAGRYWVDGVPLEARTASGFALDDPASPAVLVLLQAVQQDIHPWQDPALLDPALQGADGNLRTRWQWRLSALACDAAMDPDGLPRCPERGRMRVRLQGDGEAIGTPAAEGYQGMENTLYRVQLLRGDEGDGPPTFAWSRANGSQQHRLLDRHAQADGSLQVELENAHARNDGARVGEWVRFLHASAGAGLLPLLQVVSIDRNRMLLRPAAGASAGEYPLDGPAGLQRWHHAGSAAHGGGIAIVRDRWFALENGIEIAFDADCPLPVDDCWWIAARPAAGLMGWEDQVAQPAHGPPRVQAPLALLLRDAADAREMSCIDLRWRARLERAPAGAPASG